MNNAHASGLLLYRITNTIEYLLLQTSYGNHHWTPPKGHLDPGEDEKTAAIRETGEESGLKKEQYEIDDNFKKVIQYQVKGKDKVVVYWLAKLIDKSAQIKLSDEHQDYGWYCLEEAVSQAKYKEMVCVINSAHSYILNKLKELNESK